jgi:replication-associated recombination protein RarA
VANQKDVTANSEAGDYPVGYGKPPKHTQFKPGTSGNPKGRPKETKNLKTDLVEELAEKILVHEGDGSKKISKQRAVVKSLVTRTLKGDARAANTLLPMMMRLLDTGEGAQTEEPEELHPDELEILEAYKARLTGSRSQEGPAEATNASNAEIQSADADAGSEEEAQ